MWSQPKHNLVKQLACLAVCMFTISIVAGCNSIMHGKAGRNDKDPWYKMSFFGNPKYQSPKSMAAIWSHDVMVAKGAQPTRGFGGRIYFYNERSQAIPVEGELVVYGYDETKKATANTDSTKADKRFRFTKDQFTTHFSETDLGASYSVWIPWDIDGNSRKKIVLLPTFVSESGEIVRGQMSTLFLPGPEEASAAISEQRSQIQPFGGVRTASAVTPASGLSTNPIGPRSQQAGVMKTTTINLPSRSTISRPLSRQLPAANPSSSQRVISQPITPRQTNPQFNTSRVGNVAPAGSPSSQRLLGQPSLSVANPAVGSQIATQFGTVQLASAQPAAQPLATPQNAFATASPNAFAANPFLQSTPQSGNRLGIQAYQNQGQNQVGQIPHAVQNAGAIIAPLSTLPASSANQFQWPQPQFPSSQTTR